MSTGLSLLSFRHIQNAKSFCWNCISKHLLCFLSGVLTEKKVDSMILITILIFCSRFRSSWKDLVMIKIIRWISYVLYFWSESEKFLQNIEWDFLRFLSKAFITHVLWESFTMKLKNIKNVSDQSITLSKYLWVHNCKIISAVIAFFFDSDGICTFFTNA